MRRILLSRWMLSGIGTALLTALVWVFGPFVAALEDPLPRVAIIAAAAIVWAAVNWFLSYRAGRRDAALPSGCHRRRLGRTRRAPLDDRSTALRSSLHPV